MSGRGSSTWPASLARRPWSASAGAETSRQLRACEAARGPARRGLSRLVNHAVGFPPARDCPVPLPFPKPDLTSASRGCGGRALAAITTNGNGMDASACVIPVRFPQSAERPDAVLKRLAVAHDAGRRFRACLAAERPGAASPSATATPASAGSHGRVQGARLTTGGDAEARAELIAGARQSRTLHPVLRRPAGEFTLPTTIPAPFTGGWRGQPRPGPTYHMTVG